MYKKSLPIFLALALGLTACGTLDIAIEPASSPQPSPIVVTATPALLLPTQLPTQPATQTVTITPALTPSPAANSCDRASLVSDVTVPDGTIFAPNTMFIKTWRLKNTGTCTWTTAYRLTFMSNHQMDGPSAINLSSAVAPNTTIDLSIALTAPAAEGSYRGDWALSNAAGKTFGVGLAGEKPFWVQVVVSDATKTYQDSRGESEMGFGLVFDYPSTWYVQPTSFGVQITSFDPVNPPHKLEWTPSTISMSISTPPAGWEGDASPPSSSVLLDRFAESTKQQATASSLDITSEQRLTLAGYPAARISVVSGSGGIIDYVMIVIDDRGPLPLPIYANIEGNFELARTVLDTLRQP